MQEKNQSCDRRSPKQPVRPTNPIVSGQRNEPEYEPTTAHRDTSAIDIEKLETRTGKQLSLSDNWTDTNAFLKTIRDGGCRVFPTVLSPDFNTLHADHFHFDLGPWRTCR